MAIFNSYLPFLFAWTLISFGTGLESLGERGGRNWGNLEIGNAAAAEARPSPDQPLRWELDDLRECNLNCNRITRRLQQQDLGPQSAQTNVIIINIYIYIYSIYIYIYSYVFILFPDVSSTFINFYSYFESQWITDWQAGYTVHPTLEGASCCGKTTLSFFVELRAKHENMPCFREKQWKPWSLKKARTWRAAWKFQNLGFRLSIGLGPLCLIAGCRQVAGWLFGLRRIALPCLTSNRMVLVSRIKIFNSCVCVCVSRNLIATTEFLWKKLDSIYTIAPSMRYICMLY